MANTCLWDLWDTAHRRGSNIRPCNGSGWVHTYNEQLQTDCTCYKYRQAKATWAKGNENAVMSSSDVGALLCPLAALCVVNDISSSSACSISARSCTRVQDCLTHFRCMKASSCDLTSNASNTTVTTAGCSSNSSSGGGNGSGSGSLSGRSSPRNKSSSAIVQARHVFSHSSVRSSSQWWLLQRSIHQMMCLPQVQRMLPPKK